MIACCKTFWRYLPLLLSCGCVAPQYRLPAAQIAPKHFVVRLCEGANGSERFAADELSRHLRWMTGEEVPVQDDAATVAKHAYSLFVGRRPADDTEPLASEEGRYRVADSAAWFYGEDAIHVPAPEYRQEALDPRNRTGTLFAVYEFLEKECGVRWTMPGDAGVYLPCDTGPLALRLVSGRYRPRLERRQIRFPAIEGDGLRLQQQTIPAELRMSEENAAAARWEHLLWLRRHRMGVRPASATKVSVLPMTQFGVLDSPRTSRPARLRRTAPGQTQVLTGRPLLPDVGLPLGQERRAYDLLQQALRQGIGGTEFELTPGSWWTNGLACYVIARLHNSPSSTFEDLEREFCLLFGEAAFAVAAYYRYWREHFARTILPRYAGLTHAGGGDWQLGLYTYIEDCFSLSDFRDSVASLHHALTRPLSERQKQLVQKLILAHEHAERIFLAVAAAMRDHDNPKQLEDDARTCRVLAGFRRDFRTQLDDSLPQLVAQERRLGDVTGLDWAALFEDAKPYARLPWPWNFKPDPADVGLSEEWYKTHWDGLEQWDTARLDQKEPWQSPTSSSGAGHVKSRGGIGWYGITFRLTETAPRGELFVNFHGMHAACQVFINGRMMGAHDPSAALDSPVSFRIPIHAGTNPERNSQVLIVRVERHEGTPGGIRRPVWLSVRPFGEGN